MLRRLLSASLVAIVAIAFTAGPTFAYRYFSDRYFNTSAIDTNGDHKFDLSVCYGTSSTDPIYVNRSSLATGIAQWADASPGAFSSNGICNNDGSNIQVLWSNRGPCANGSYVAGETENKTSGYNQITVWFNTTCRTNNMYDWAGTISAGKISAVSTLVHEVGHALRIAHSDKNGALMYSTGPIHCALLGQRWSLTQDDAQAFRAAYPGLIDTAILFPTNSPCHD